MKTVFAWTRITVDLAIFVLVLISAIMMFTGSIGVLAEGGIGFLKYFTVQSNLLMGAAALVALPFDVLVALDKKPTNPIAVKIFYFVGTIGVAIAFLVVFTFLGPTMGYAFMLTGPNLFMHLFTPVLALVRLIVLETPPEGISFKQTFFGLIHLILYGVFYLVNVIIHDGYGQTQYDWYGFAQGGLALGLLAFVIVLAGAYLLCFLLYLAQKKVLKLENR